MRAACSTAWPRSWSARRCAEAGVPPSDEARGDDELPPPELRPRKLAGRWPSARSAVPGCGCSTRAPSRSAISVGLSLALGIGASRRQCRCARARRRRSSRRPDSGAALRRRFNRKLEEHHAARSREQMAASRRPELRDGYYVNLGIGMPTLVANYIPPGIDVRAAVGERHARHRPLSLRGRRGSRPHQRRQADRHRDRRARRIFSSAESFAMIRGGHIDMCVLGAMQVSDARRPRQLDDPRQDGQGHGRRDGPRRRRAPRDRDDGAHRQGREEDPERVLAAADRQCGRCTASSPICACSTSTATGWSCASWRPASPSKRCRRRPSRRCASPPTSRRMDVSSWIWLGARRALAVTSEEDAAAQGASFETDADIPLEDVYRPPRTRVDYDASSACPGEYPYTRGVQPTMYRGRFWTMRQYAGFGNARRVEQALSLPAQAGADRTLGGVRSADADGARSRSSAGARRGRPGRRLDRRRSTTCACSSTGCRSARSRRR